VAYLLYMAWATFRDRGALTVEEDDAAPRSVRQVIVSGVLVNILNPKLSIFFVAFLPQFVSSGSPALPQMLALSGVFMAVTFLVFAAYGLFAATIRKHVITRPQVLTWMRRTFGGAFIALGAKLALTQR
jgi:threonine/homoserine/homoserine lactone efflux protein